MNPQLTAKWLKDREELRWAKRIHKHILRQHGKTEAYSQFLSNVGHDIARGLLPKDIYLRPSFCEIFNHEKASRP